MRRNGRKLDAELLIGILPLDMCPCGASAFHLGTEARGALNRRRNASFLLDPGLFWRKKHPERTADNARGGGP